MPNWVKQTLKVMDDPGWPVTPGCNVFIANRGAVRFDYPHAWVAVPSTDCDSMQLYDRQPPDDNCRIEISVMELNPRIDWSGLPLRQILPDILKDDSRKLYGKAEYVQVKRKDLELVWVEHRFIDPVEKREARSRACLALGSSVMPFITMEYWRNDRGQFVSVWDTVLTSLTLGQYIKLRPRSYLN